MSVLLHAIGIACGAERLQGIVHEPPSPGPLGVVIIVGGPQYRAGSHRQFVLLARELAVAGFATLRFDYRGMGDSDGAPRTFESIGEDIRGAIDALCEQVPAVREVALWGLCDAATAAAFYASRDSRVRALALANPWVRSQAGLARSLLRRHYLRRIVDRELWRDLLAGRFAVSRALGGLLDTLRKARIPRASPQDSPEPAGDLAARLYDDIATFRGRVLFLLSGADLTAGEFRDVIAASRRWRRLMRRPQLIVREIPDADHTFSTRAWRDRVAAWTRDWLRES